MKVILIFMICCAGLCFCNVKAGKQKMESAGSLFTDSISFAKQIFPVLEKKCSPCHFPGGKMYERMPFDKSETIISHKTGILKRFKDEEQLALIKQFIEQNKKPGSEGL